MATPMKMKTFNALRSSKMKRYQIYPLQLYGVPTRTHVEKGKFPSLSSFKRKFSSVDQDVVEKPNGLAVSR